MDPFSGIKRWAGNLILRKRAGSVRRRRKMFNFSSASSAAVLLYTHDEKHFRAAQVLVKFLKNNNIDTWSLGFVDSPQVSEAYSYQIGMNHFTKKDLNWYGRPKSSSAEQFISKEFDILIDLTMEDFYPTFYIASLSRSRFKAGRFVQNDSPYDLMIEIDEEKTIEYFIDQIKHYISELKIENHA